jgi:hypothetical protein
MSNIHVDLVTSAIIEQYEQHIYRATHNEIQRKKYLIMAEGLMLLVKELSRDSVAFESSYKEMQDFYNKNYKGL